MKTVGRKPNIALYVASIVLILTLLSLYLTTGLYAKYISSDSVKETAHTAAFYIDAKGTVLTRSFEVDGAVPGMETERELIIVNKSEVKVKYTLTLQNETNNLPLVFVFTDKATNEQFSSTDGKCVVEKTLEAGTQTDDYALNIVWEISGEAEDENLQYAGMLDYIAVTLEAVQVD